MVSNALGLAEGLGFAAPTMKRVDIRPPWRYLPNWPWLATLNALAAGSDPLQPPWPDLLISCGRRSALLSIAIRRASAGRTRTIHIQDPKAGRNAYDLLILPRHDGVTGDNVVITLGSLHRVTPGRLSAAAGEFGGNVAHLPKPRVAVLVGGSNRAYTMTTAWMRTFAESLENMCKGGACSLMITVSRRTPPEAAGLLRSVAERLPAAYWDGIGANPYFGYLGLSDAIVATCDSVSMISEACATGKPVLIAAIPGRSGRSGRFEQFVAELFKRGHARPFAGRLEPGEVRRLTDMEETIAEVGRRLGRRGAGR